MRHTASSSQLEDCSRSQTRFGARKYNALNRVFSLLKQRLPPKASFALRYAKASIVDTEMAELARFAKMLGEPGSLALDVGANTGLYSAMLARHIEKVLSFEPHPDCASYMRRVLPANCTVIEAAASDEARVATLRVPVAEGARETTRATISAENSFEGLNISGADEIQVQSKPLDTLVTPELLEQRRLVLIKVDVEGHELPVLLGARELLKTFRPGLYIELEDRHGTDTKGIFDFFDGIDYRPVRFDQGRYILAPRLDVAARQAQTVNIVLLPREKIGSDITAGSGCRLAG